MLLFGKIVLWYWHKEVFLVCVNSLNRITQETTMAGNSPGFTILVNVSLSEICLAVFFDSVINFLFATLFMLYFTGQKFGY